ncbi:MAG: hypothetical protein K2I62_07765 [Alistipes sp.]|nr:hypothetical protein [Alistipes sp.]
MKQATGSRTPRLTNKVSIQRSLDGHSFSVTGLDRDFTGEAVVTVEILTPQTLLVPTELLQTSTAAELLAAAGMACKEGQQAVRSMPRMLGPDKEIAAVMALDEDMLQRIRERLGYRADFVTPLLDEPTTARQTVWLRRTPGLLYIKVFGRTLRLAEVIPAATEADMLYFIDRLGKVLPLGRMQLHLAGTGAKALRKLIGNRFRHVVCES